MASKNITKKTKSEVEVEATNVVIEEPKQEIKIKTPVKTGSGKTLRSKRSRIPKSRNAA